MEFHEIANLFPMMVGDEYRMLREDIATHGLIEPITTYQGKILDGRNRYTACLDLSIEPQYIEWNENTSNPLDYVISKNLHRRHLNESQRAVVASKLANMERGNYSKSVNLPISPISQAKAAEMLNVSTSMVGTTKAIERDAPELMSQLASGEMTVHEAETIIKKKKKQKILDEIKNTYVEIIPDEMLGDWPLGIVSQVSDSCEALAQLPDNSINLIFTDPPYNLDKDYGEDISDNRPDYMEWCDKWFTEVSRILVLGGSFYVMHYPETCAEWKPLLDKLLTYRRWISWVYNSNIGHGPDNWRRSHRTILYYTKGTPAYFDGIADPQPYKNPTDSRVAKLSPDGTTPYDWWEYDLVKNVAEDKVWPNQLPVALVSRIIKTSSAPGDIVLDPFIGSGTTAIAAVQNNRRWIGFDKNPSSTAITAKRLENVPI